MAAIDAIGRTGDASCVAPLLKVATESEDLIAPVKAALVNIPDEAVNHEIVTRLPEAQGDVDAQLLIEVVGLRRIEATDALVKALDSSRPAVRHAALESLGRTVAPERLGLLDQTSRLAQAQRRRRRCRDRPQDRCCSHARPRSSCRRIVCRSERALRLLRKFPFWKSSAAWVAPQALQTLAGYGGRRQRGSQGRQQPADG